MSMATGTAIAVGAAVAGGAQIESSVIGSKAATSAAQTQAASGNKALDLQSSIYNQQQANLAPYRQIGSVGLAALGNLAGHPATMAPSGNGWVGLNSMTMPPGSGPGDGARMPTASMGGGPGGAPGVGLASMGNGSEPMVLMRSPDGQTTKSIPASQVDHFKSMGAQVISNGGPGASALPRLGAQG
jgi:hypothetical protein